MQEYPFNSPQVLTDQIYQDYGGFTGTSTAAQRAAAYLIAEKQMTIEIGTLLPRAIITGTFSTTSMGRPIITDYNRVRQILGVTIYYVDETPCDCDLTSGSGCAFVENDTYGYLYIVATSSETCGCGTVLVPWQVAVVYECGLGSGTAWHPDMLLALTMAAEINLNEIIDRSANEGVGDVGVRSFSNQSYSENRVWLKRTSFGTSARANKIAQLVQGFRKDRPLAIGR